MACRKHLEITKVIDKLSTQEKQFWQKFTATLPAQEQPENPNITASIAGNDEIADQLLGLYLAGKKTAGSGLVRDYQSCGDELPKVGQYWIILNENKEPKCIVKTIRVVQHRFDQVPEEVAIAEGEGDLSLEYWRKGHTEFFTPFLKDWGAPDLNKEMVITEFFKVVYK